MFRTLRFLGLMLVLVLLLGAPAASAAGSRELEGLSVQGVLSALWETFTGLLGLSEPDVVLSTGTSSGGGSDDPNGGPGMDPNGGAPKGP